MPRARPDRRLGGARTIEIAAWQDGGWQFSAPKLGWVAYAVDEGALLTWNGTAWGDFFSTVTAIQNLALLGIGTTADATNPFSAKLNNALWVAKTVAEGGDGDLRYKLSKESAAKTLSFLFQDNFSGRAEIGLTGDDDFHFKTSRRRQQLDRRPCPRQNDRRSAAQFGGAIHRRLVARADHGRPE